MVEAGNQKKFKYLVIFYTAIIGLHQMADYLYGVSYMVTLNTRLSIEYIAILIGIKEVGFLVFDFPSGVISDFFGRKKTAGVSLIIYGLALILLGLSTSFILLISIFLLMSFAESMFSGSPGAWFYDVLVKENRIKDREKIIPYISGVAELMSFVSSAVAIVLMYYNATYPLMVGGVIGILAGILCLLFFEDNKGNSENKNFFVVLRDFSKDFIHDKNIRGILAFSVFDYAAFSVFIFTWQLYLLNRFNIRETDISILFVCFTICMAIGSFITSFLLKHLKGIVVSIIGQIGIVLSFLAIAFTDSLYVVIASCFLFEICLAISSTSVGIWRNDFISSENRASFYSGISSVDSLLSIAITPCLGMVIKYLGYSRVWILATLIQVVSLMFIIRFKMRHRVQNDVRE